MLPKKLRLKLFDSMSVKTMKYVSAVPSHEASGLTKRVYDMIAKDFFVNGSLTSRSRVPEILAAIWTVGRESMLVDDELDRTTKEAICAVMSNINDCPYCGDMLISLVHAGNKHDAASALMDSQFDAIKDPILRSQLSWVHAIASPGENPLPAMPFTDDQLPELLASMMSMSDINRYSHVVMDGSPITATGNIQKLALRWFGTELKATKVNSARPGTTLSLLPAAELPEDLAWAKPNPRIADAVARWVAAVEREAGKVISPEVRECVKVNLANWHGEVMPLSARWVDKEVSTLTGNDQAIARLTLLLAKAPYQVSQNVVEPLLYLEEEDLIRVLAWASYIGSRRTITIIKEKIDRENSIHCRTRHIDQELTEVRERVA